jgi:hypothetical protein
MVQIIILLVPPDADKTQPGCYHHIELLSKALIAFIGFISHSSIRMPEIPAPACMKRQRGNTILVKLKIA